MKTLKRTERLFFQVAFFRCWAQRRLDWHDIEVEVAAGDMSAHFHFASSVTVAEIKKRTARKILIEMRNYTKMIQDYIAGDKL
jgi:hypothetical protein